MSDEIIAQRHERSEREENKRFMTHLNMPHQTRIRPNRRIDRADSGANTPGMSISYFIQNLNPFATKTDYSLMIRENFVNNNNNILLCIRIIFTFTTMIIK